MTPRQVPWVDHLAAFEEWVRRMRTALDGAAEADASLPELATVPDGPLPEHLRVRAASALQALHGVEQAGQRRRAALTRERAYTRW